jgi:hypothetical protein
MRARVMPRAFLLGICLLAGPLAAQTPATEDLSLRHPPRLSGIVRLDSLSLFDGSFDRDQKARPEAVDIAATASGPIVLFSDRFLSLGLHLEVTERTARELAYAPSLPDGFAASRLFLNPLQEPLLYSAVSGTALLFHCAEDFPERFETGVRQPLSIAALPRGGIILVQEQDILLFRRRGYELVREQTPLPSRFVTAVEADARGRLLIYDVRERAIRIIGGPRPGSDGGGQEEGEALRIIPGFQGPASLFPQVFRARPDGSFLLGSAGELWCIEADGSPRWRLARFSAGFRQSLPSYYRIACSPDPRDPVFFLLDVQGGRILKFSEETQQGGGEIEGVGPVNGPAAANGLGEGAGADGVEETGAAHDAPTPDSIEETLIQAFENLQGPSERLEEALRLCLDKGLLLQADYLLRAGGSERVDEELAVRAKEKQARLLADSARRLERELRLPEAEKACNRSLALYRELRSLDPVDPLYPQVVDELTLQRNGVRETLMAEKLLEAKLDYFPQAPGNSGDGADRAGRAALRLLLVNRSGGRLEQVEVQARLAGLEISGWRKNVGPLQRGGETSVALPLSVGGPGPLSGEDLRLTLNVEAFFLREGRAGVQYFNLPVLFPAGTLNLP